MQNRGSDWRGWPRRRVGRGVHKARLRRRGSQAQSGGQSLPCHVSHVPCAVQLGRFHPPGSLTYAGPCRESHLLAVCGRLLGRPLHYAACVCQCIMAVFVCSCCEQEHLLPCPASCDAATPQFMSLAALPSLNHATRCASRSSSTTGGHGPRGAAMCASSWCAHPGPLA